MFLSFSAQPWVPDSPSHLPTPTSPTTPTSPIFLRTNAQEWDPSADEAIGIKKTCTTATGGVEEEVEGQAEGFRWNRMQSVWTEWMQQQQQQQQLEQQQQQ